MISPNAIHTATNAELGLLAQVIVATTGALHVVLTDTDAGMNVPLIPIYPNNEAGKALAIAHADQLVQS